LSFQRIVIPAHCHSGTLSFQRIVIPAHCHSGTLSFRHIVIPGLTRNPAAVYI
jgi:hypothetical protein